MQWNTAQWCFCSVIESQKLDIKQFSTVCITIYVIILKKQKLTQKHNSLYKAKLYIKFKIKLLQNQPLIAINLTNERQNRAKGK